MGEYKLEDYLMERQVQFNKRNWTDQTKEKKRIKFEDLAPSLQKMYVEMWARDYEITKVED